jgi:glucosyl-dolichyl phosphate glucuronosyltransferase
MNPEVSIVISTYNRSQMLARAIESMLKQQVSVTYELVVVDNNCTDDTAQVVKQYANQSPMLRYMFEPKQGVSYGRNTGIAAAHADLIAFTDDDVLVESNWIERVKAVFDAEPDHGCIGGRVLPNWPRPEPTWLNRSHWSPLALLDYGEAQTMDANHRKCLVTANMSVRRSVFEQIGYFRPQFQRPRVRHARWRIANSKNAIGKLADVAGSILRCWSMQTSSPSAWTSRITGDGITVTGKCTRYCAIP